MKKVTFAKGTKINDEDTRKISNTKKNTYFYF